MTEERREAHAVRIAEIIVDEQIGQAEYCYVYEDEALEDASEEDLKAIHDIIRKRVKVTITLD